MPGILVLEDRSSDPREPARSLESRGQIVHRVADERAALACACRNDLDGLVTDWIVPGSRLNGLQLATAVRVLQPGLPVVLATTLATASLRRRAQEETGVVLLELGGEDDERDTGSKTTDKLASARDELRERPPAPPPTLPAVFLSLDADGRLLRAMPAARSKFAELHTGRVPPYLSSWLGSEPEARLRASASGWQPVESGGWLACARLLAPDTWLLALATEPDSWAARTHPLTRTLLALPHPNGIEWPAPGRVLLIDDDEMVRRLNLTRFERIPCVCHAAESLEEGLRVFRRDPEVRTVILDYGLPGDHAAFARALLSERPGLTLVGSSGGDRRTEFEAAGVRHYLPKPWRLEELVALLAEPLGCAGR